MVLQGTGQESVFLCAKAISLTILKNSSNFSGLFSPRHHLVLSEVSQGGTQSRYCSVSLFTFDKRGGWGKVPGDYFYADPGFKHLDKVLVGAD